ncbi:MAG TPA: AAA family ATPase [Phycisphaerales bacterium]|nr:AAA family ATPase [Phycisphaerales bacterium]
MKLDYLEVSGFRGFKGRHRIEFGRGFTVLVGSNGSGKSTVCDAVEFALLGSIRPASERSERREGIGDYLWWRGAGTVEECFVELGLVCDTGVKHVIHRSPSKSAEWSSNLSAALVIDRPVTTELVQQLCQTAILRDEDITRLSVDLPEASRFSFVRAALASTDFGQVKGRMDEAGAYAEAQELRAQRDYDVKRAVLSEQTARLSALRTEANRVSDVEKHLQMVRQLLSLPSASVAELQSAAEKELAACRAKADAIERLTNDLQRVEADYPSGATATADAELTKLREALDSETRALAAARELVSASAKVDPQDGAPKAALLGGLLENGRLLGLQDGACPLCGNGQSEEHFRDHLAKLKNAVEAESAQEAVRAAAFAKAIHEFDLLTARVKKTQAEMHTRRAALDFARSQTARLTSQAAALGIAVSDSAAATLGAAAAALPPLRVRIRLLEFAIVALRTSQAAEQISEQERELEATRQQVATAERFLGRIQAARAAIKDSSHTLVRVRAEYVEEQLAALTPLLQELYQRLRPHIDWQTVGYHVRGDVRRMLSLEVGDGLNPSFVFSSGQKRAVGLAFLLALHLSRGWCGLKTLILDDPVQHVDDYRVLHLTEVLASIRRSDRQIICAVEDQALADLLARRLRSQSDQPGAVIRLVYEAGSGSRVAERRDVKPHERRVLTAG